MVFVAALIVLSSRRKAAVGELKIFFGPVVLGAYYFV